MSNLDDELLREAEDDARTIEFIRNYLPQELKEKFTAEELYYFLDLIVEYCTSSGVLDETPDEDGCIEIDADKVVEYLVVQAKKEGMGEYSPEDILFVVQGEMEYGESLDEE